MARGYSASADILKRTIDGVDLNDLWAEFSQTLDLRQRSRTALMSLFTYATTNPGDEVVQTIGSVEPFEVASEYGAPQSLRNPVEAVQVGFPFEWYDRATRYTWRFLAEADRKQVEAVHNAALAADNELLFRLFRRALFLPTSPGVNREGTRIVPLWNGADGSTPPEWDGNTFTSAHSHYTTSGATTVDGGDLEVLTENVRHHGYGREENGDRLVILCNPLEARVIRGFRAGVNSAGSDFIPSVDAPAWITDETIIGDRPAGEYEGLRVFGSYGPALLSENNLIPQGYLVAVATGGSNSPRNPLAIREHRNADLRGLKQFPGNPGGYPLIDSTYVHGLGIGVRNRGAAAVMQLTTSGTYTAPAGI